MEPPRCAIAGPAEGRGVRRACQRHDIGNRAARHGHGECGEDGGFVDATRQALDRRMRLSGCLPVGAHNIDGAVEISRERALRDAVQHWPEGLLENGAGGGARFEIQRQSGQRPADGLAAQPRLLGGDIQLAIEPGNVLRVKMIKVTVEECLNFADEKAARQLAAAMFARALAYPGGELPRRGRKQVAHHQIEQEVLIRISVENVGRGKRRGDPPCCHRFLQPLRCLFTAKPYSAQ